MEQLPPCQRVLLYTTFVLKANKYSSINRCVEQSAFVPVAAPSCSSSLCAIRDTVVDIDVSSMLLDPSGQVHVSDVKTLSGAWTGYDGNREICRAILRVNKYGAVDAKSEWCGSSKHVINAAGRDDEEEVYDVVESTGPYTVKMHDGADDTATIKASGPRNILHRARWVDKVILAAISRGTQLVVKRVIDNP